MTRLPTDRPRDRDRPGPARLSAGLVLIAAAGCGSDDGLGRQPVRGEVTLDGRPLREGTVLFDPDGGGAGTAVGGPVRDGRFAIPADKGPAPGRYQVRVYASSGRQAPPRAGDSPRTPRPMVELIPDQYNSQSTLTAVVTKGGANDFAYTLASDPEGPPPERAGSTAAHPERRRP